LFLFDVGNAGEAFSCCFGEDLSFDIAPLLRWLARVASHDIPRERSPPASISRFHWLHSLKLKSLHFFKMEGRSLIAKTFLNDDVELRWIFY